MYRPMGGQMNTARAQGRSLAGMGQGLQRQGAQGPRAQALGLPPREGGAAWPTGQAEEGHAALSAGEP